MLMLIANKLVQSVITLLFVSVAVFVVIQLPPGDYADTWAAKQAMDGVVLSREDIEAVRHRFGLNDPWSQQYVLWMKGILLEGNFGYSFEWRRPNTEVIKERLPFTLIIAGLSLVVIYGVAIPIGIYSGLRQYSLGDNVASFVGYIGLATPNFLIALVFLYIAQVYFGISAGGLYSPEYRNADWSWGKFIDLLQHIWIPVVVLGTAGTASTIRTLRAMLLDEKNKLYVTAARAGGLPERHVIMHYPVRMAMNPVVSTLGWELTTIISGAPIVGMVLALPDTGPLFINSLLSQDMYLAGGILLIFAFLTILGSFISDILLMLLDPRIRLGAQEV